MRVFREARRNEYNIAPRRRAADVCYVNYESVAQKLRGKVYERLTYNSWTPILIPVMCSLMGNSCARDISFRDSHFIRLSRELKGKQTLKDEQQKTVTL